MRRMQTIKLIAGSVAVYVVVACGSAELRSAGVPDAKGQTSPLSPIVATETCSVFVDAGGSGAAFAEHQFPGFTAQQLSAVHFLGTVASDVSATSPPGYNQISFTGALVRDGSVAVSCGNASFPTYQLVTFILPQ